MSSSREETAPHVPPPHGMRTFVQVLANTMVANVTTSFLWFALTFWVYIETQSVLATGVIGGAYMLLVAVFSMVFGTIVDRHRKQHVMVLSSVVTLTSFLVAGGLYLVQPESALLDIRGPWFWLFAGIILFGAVVENMRNIALSTTVTLLVPVERHANANGMVGTVQGGSLARWWVLSRGGAHLLGAEPTFSAGNPPPRRRTHLLGVARSAGGSGGRQVDHGAVDRGRIRREQRDERLG